MSKMTRDGGKPEKKDRPYSPPVGPKSINYEKPGLGGGDNHSSSGIKCIDILPSGKFRVRVSGLHIGCYSDMEDAVESAQDAILQFHGEHGRLPLLP